jgi:hypothetical protein
MSWFFGGGNDDKKDSSSSAPVNVDSYSSSDFSSSSSNTFDSGNFSAPGRSSGNFEQELMMEQQKIMIQAVMMKLTETAFDTCITKPSSSLSSSEQSCIGSVVGKYLDTSELVVSRFQQSGN